jgi:hypothetical protein
MHAQYANTRHCQDDQQTVDDEYKTPAAADTADCTEDVKSGLQDEVYSGMDRMESEDKIIMIAEVKCPLRSEMPI